MNRSRTAITVYYLEMTERDQLRPKYSQQPNLSVVESEIALPELSRFLYAAVGAQWHWWQRLSWTYQQWLDWLQQPSVRTWVAYVSGTPAGYFELEQQAQNSIELAYFGLLPRFISSGIGGHLLTTALQQAWGWQAQRVWLHTCSLDHPHALANYQARGLSIYRQETVYEHLPDQALEPWPGAFINRP